MHLLCDGPGERFAFVHFADEAQARAAAAATNGVYFEGRQLEVRLKGDPRGAPSERPAPPPREAFNEDAKLYVAHLPAHYAQEDVRTLLQPYGLVQECKVIMDRDSGRSRGFGFAQMMDPSQVGAGGARARVPGSALIHPSR